MAVCELARIEPPFKHLRIEEGRLALQESRFRDAAAILLDATADEGALRAQDAPAFEGLGRAYVRLGRLDLAEAAYRRAVELDPDYAIGHFNLAATFTQTRRFAEALGPLDEVRRIEGDTRRVLGARAEALAGSGDRAGAIDSVNAWLSQEPDDAGMLVLLGLLCAQGEDFVAAKRHLERALALEPGNQEARGTLQAVNERLDRNN